LSSLQLAAERPGTPEKFSLHKVLCAFRIPVLRRELAEGGGLCNRKYLQNPKVNYLISGFASKFLASGLSLFVFGFLYLCCSG
jgi:hypothetical protein